MGLICIKSLKTTGILNFWFLCLMELDHLLFCTVWLKLDVWLDGELSSTVHLRYYGIPVFDPISQVQ